MSFIRSAFLRNLQNLPAKRKRKQRSSSTVASNHEFDSSFHINGDLNFREAIQSPELQAEGKRRKWTNIDVVDAESGSSGVTSTTYDSPINSLTVNSDAETLSETVTNDSLVPVKASGPALDFIIRSKRDKNNNILFQCRWKGYSDEHDSWETKTDLISDGFDAHVENFENQSICGDHDQAFPNIRKTESANDLLVENNKIEKDNEHENEVSKNAQSASHSHNDGLDRGERRGKFDEILVDYDARSSINKNVREISNNSKTSTKQVVSTHVEQHCTYVDHDTQVFGRDTNKNNVEEDSYTHCYGYEKSLMHRPRKLKGIKCTINSHHIFNKKYLVSLQTSKWNRYVGVLNNYADAKKAGTKLLENILARVQLEEGNKSKKSFAGSESEPSVSVSQEVGAQELTSRVFRDSFGKLQLRSVGCLITEGDDRHNYHTKRFLYPVGFCSVRSYFSLSNPAQKVDYYCEIHEGEEAPRFVVHESGSWENFESKSMSGAWRQVLERINQKRNELGMSLRMKTISGPQMFGFLIPQLMNILESLPGVSNCENYRPDECRISDVGMGESNIYIDKRVVNVLNDPVSSICLLDKQTYMLIALV